ncbi:transporter [Actinoplanes sp. KI2]|uniref:transporter n=1 Tax=Actinoplanes sp. KI2 TaxID=2983315 RepID=UPI0021D5B856|nr:transporter [Actinoplanes sp. KI2]MCU7724101.1 transporter [Actinoplanes sp. KI2]
MEPIDDDEPLGNPADSLALIQRERTNLSRDLTPDPRLMYWPWGIAWLIGFGLMFLRFGPDGRVFVDLPDWLPLTVLSLSFIAAGVITGVTGGRVAAQTRGPSSSQGVMYGWTWGIAFSGMSLLFAQYGDALPDEKLGLLWAGGLVALTGALHMAGGAIWNDRQLFILGAWTSVINVVGILAGPGWHSLIVAIAGGGGMLIFGFLGWLRFR